MLFMKAEKLWVGLKKVWPYLLIAGILLGGLLYYRFKIADRWISAESFQRDLEKIGKPFNIHRSCEEWIERMHREDGGPLIMRGPYRLCEQIGRKYAYKARCEDGIMYILCVRPSRNE